MNHSPKQHRAPRSERSTYRKFPARHSALAGLMVLALLGAACSGGSTVNPTTPDGGPLMLNGTLNFQSTSSHDLDMPKDGLMEVTLSDIQVLLFDTTQVPLASLLIGFGLGQRDEAGECSLTSNFAMVEGQLTVFRLSEDTYCLSIFDTGSLPEDAVIDYTLAIEITI